MTFYYTAIYDPEFGDWAPEQGLCESSKYEKQIKQSTELT